MALWTHRSVFTQLGTGLFMQSTSSNCQSFNRLSYWFSSVRLGSFWFGLDSVWSILRPHRIHTKTHMHTINTIIAGPFNRSVAISVYAVGSYCKICLPVSRVTMFCIIYCSKCLCRCMMCWCHTQLLHVA